MAKPTMEDVARRAGVSRSLVSLVYQGGSNVSDARRTAVLQAAEELGYRPNRMARNLARGRSMTIGVVIDDLHPFFARVVEGIEEHADAAGYHVFIANGARDADRTSDALASFAALQVDGAIAIGPRCDTSRLIRATANIPLVLVAFEAPAAQVDVLNNDESVGASLVVDHLHSLGHQHIVHVAGGDGGSSSGRSAAYSSAMKRLGLGSHIDVVDGDYTYESGQKAAIEIANRTPRPTAVFASNDINALGMISEFHRLDVRVPEDISVVGYDDTDYGGSIGNQGLTTVRQPARTLGARSAELLIDRLDRNRSEAVRETLAPTLVVRSSTAAVSRR